MKENKIEDAVKWLTGTAEMARLFGHCPELPANFSTLPNDERAKLAALSLFKLRHAAETGDKGAAIFFRDRRQAHLPIAPDAGSVRVGFVTPVMDFPGGTEEWIYSLMRRLSEKATISGIAVSDSKADEGELERFAASTRVIVGRGSADMLAAFSDVLIMWGVDSRPVDLLPGGKCKAVLVLHGTGDWTQSIANTTAPQVDAVVGVSQDSAKLWPGAVAIDNGVDLDRCVPTPQERGMMRGAWGLRPGQKTLGYIGRMVPEKDPRALAYAVKELPPGWVAVFCGTCDPVILAECERIATGKIIYQEPVHRIAEVLGSLDCVMQPSDHEGFGLALVEAWAAAVPTVSTAVGIVPEGNKRFGQLTVTVDHKANPKELAAAVSVATSQANQPVVQRAERAAREYYNANRMAEDWLVLIHKLVGR